MLDRFGLITEIEDLGHILSIDDFHGELAVLVSML